MKFVIDLFRLKCERDEQLVFETIGLACCQHSHHGVALTVEADGFADDIAVAAETLHPEPVGHDDDAVPADLPFLRQKIPSQEERSSHHVVEARCG